MISKLLVGIEVDVQGSLSPRFFHDAGGWSKLELSAILTCISVDKLEKVLNQIELGYIWRGII